MLPFVSASLPDDFASSPEALVSTAQTPGPTETKLTSSLQGTRDTLASAAVAKSSLLNSKAAEFIPSTFVDKTSSTPRPCNDLEAPKKISHGVFEGQSPQLVERTFQSVVEIQQKQNETIIATHQQLTAVMTLPQPTVTKFKGDPIEYNNLSWPSMPVFGPKQPPTLFCITVSISAS